MTTKIDPVFVCLWDIPRFSLFYRQATKHGYSEFHLLDKHIVDLDLSDLLLVPIGSTHPVRPEVLSDFNPDIYPVISYELFTMQNNIEAIIAFKDTETKMEWMLKYA